MSLFSAIEWDIALIGSILLFLVIFQAGMGSFFFAYVGEVCHGSAVSLSQFALFVNVLVLSLITQPILDTLGTTWSFFLFCVFNLVGGFYILIFVKEIDGLTKNEINNLYGPEYSRVSTRMSTSGVESKPSSVAIGSVDSSSLIGQSFDAPQ